MMEAGLLQAAKINSKDLILTADNINRFLDQKGDSFYDVKEKSYVNSLFWTDLILHNGPIINERDLDWAKVVSSERKSSYNFYSKKFSASAFVDGVLHLESSGPAWGLFAHQRTMTMMLLENIGDVFDWSRQSVYYAGHKQEDTFELAKQEKKRSRCSGLVNVEGKIEHILNEQQKMAIDLSITSRQLISSMSSDIGSMDCDCLEDFILLKKFCENPTQKNSLINSAQLMVVAKNLNREWSFYRGSKSLCQKHNQVRGLSEANNYFIPDLKIQDIKIKEDSEIMQISEEDITPGLSR